jgi:outer membrane protein TolC
VGWSVGLVLEIPLGNREAKARRDLAELEVRRAEVAAEQLAQATSEELNVAWRATQVSREQLELSRSAAAVAETKVANELERYRSGKTTAHILSTVQAELAKERAAREQAVADFNKALVSLWTASGTLFDELQRKQG